MLSGSNEDGQSVGRDALIKPSTSSYFTQVIKEKHKCGNEREHTYTNK